MEDTTPTPEQPEISQAVREQDHTRKTILYVIASVVVVAAVFGVVLWLLNPRPSETGGDVRFVRNPAMASPSPAPLVLDPSQGNAAVALQDPALASPVAGTASPLETLNAQGALPIPVPTAAPAQTQTQRQELVLIVDGQPAQLAADGTVIRLGQGQAAAVERPVQAAAVPAPEATPAVLLGQDQPKAAKPAPSKKPAKPVAASKPAPAKTAPAPAAADSAATGKQFWIQVISSPNRDRVEQVQGDLAALGFRGRISTKNVDGKDFYRLRYGPYVKKDEAVKFLDWVKMIKGFEASYISQEAVR